MKTKSVQEIQDCVQAIADEMGVEIVEVQMRASKNPSLTFFVDTEEGVDLDTLEKFHRAIDPLLDELDPTYGTPYTLNVSSPGLDRPLKTARDFERRMGEKVEIKLFAPLQGKKVLEMTLVGYDGNCVTVTDGKEEKKIELTKIAKITRAIDFDGLNG